MLHSVILKTVVIDSIKIFTNYVRNYGEYDKSMDMGIDQELVLVLPSSLINEYIGCISEATVTVKYTVLAKIDSVQCLIGHWDACINLNEKKYKSQ